MKGIKREAHRETEIKSDAEISWGKAGPAGCCPGDRYRFSNRDDNERVHKTGSVEGGKAKKPRKPKELGNEK